MQDKKKHYNSDCLWQRILYFLKFKSPNEGLKSLKKEDIPALTIILLFGIICLAVIVIVAMFLT